MTDSRKPTIRDWRSALVVGAALGIAILGIGGRLGMRTIAVVQGQSPLFSIDGSIAVILLGGAAGVVVAVFFMLSRVAFPQHRLGRTVLFWALVGIVVSRGLRPISMLNVGVFGPLFILHGGLLTTYWCRMLTRRVL